MSNESHSDSKQHALFALLLGIMGLLILLVFITIRSQADDASTTSGVTNSLASVDSIVVGLQNDGLADDITLTENTTTTVYVSGTFTDLNTCNDPANGGQIKVALGRSSNFTSDDCGAFDANDCVTEATAMTTGSGNGTYWDCSVGACDSSTDTTGTFVCNADLQYFLEPTDTGTYSADTLKVAVSIHDGTGFGSIATNTSQEANTTTAIALDDSSIDYGTVALGGTSAEQTVVVTNTGNSISGIKVNISGTDMSCNGQTGAIDKGQQHWSTTAAQAYGTMTALTGTAAQMFTSMAKATAAASPVTQSTYWKLQLPASGVGGTCAGTVTYAPVAL